MSNESVIEDRQYVFPKDAAPEVNAALWYALASVYGWNELARRSTTLGEKVFLRLARNGAELHHSQEEAQAADSVRPSAPKQVAVRKHGKSGHK